MIEKEESGQLTAGELAKIRALEKPLIEACKKGNLNAMAAILALSPGSKAAVDLHCGINQVQTVYLLRRLFSEYPDEVQHSL